MGMIDVIFESCNDSYISPFEALSSGNISSGSYITEAAKFSLFPKFASYKEEFPDLAQYDDLMKEADTVLKKPKKKKFEDGVGEEIRCMTKALHYIHKAVTGINIASIAVCPAVSVAGAVITQCLTSVIDYAFMTDNYDIAQKSALKTINELKRMSAKTKDPKAKKKIDDLIHRLDKNLDDMIKS